MSWKPAKTIAECDAFLTAPGQLHETELQMIDGRVQKVYKQLWPSIRSFILLMVQQQQNKELMVFEDMRLTFQQSLDRSLRAAALFRDVYGVKKGDRVTIVSRNYPEYVIAFFASQLLGAVTVFVNAWLPSTPLHHSINLAKSKLVIVDTERAPLLDLALIKRESNTQGFLLFRSHEANGRKFPEMIDWDTALDGYTGDIQSVLNTDPGILPEDDATIFFTSGTTGLPKGVLSTHRAFLSNMPNLIYARLRAFLRQGQEMPAPDPSAPQKGILLSIPLFHVTGTVSLVMFAMLGGTRIVMMKKWDVEQAAKLIPRENVAAAGGVPSVVSDLVESSAAGAPTIDSFIFGGAPAHVGLPALAAKTFPNAVMSQAYGLTETNAVAVSISGEDYLIRPTSTGLPTPIVQLLIVNYDGRIMKPGEVGEIWIKSTCLMKEYYNDPEATRKALTPDGWFKSGDLGMLDEEGFLYIKDRIKDIIIRGGENIDTSTIENAIHKDTRIMEVAAIGVPDPRLGELVAAVVRVKKRYQGSVSEEELIKFVGGSLPRHAVPVMIMIQDEPLERNPAGKIVKLSIRKRAEAEWARRVKESQAQGKAPRSKL